MLASSQADLPELADCLGTPVPGLLLLRYVSAVALDRLVSALRCRTTPRPLHEVCFEPRTAALGYCPELVDYCRSLAGPAIPVLCLRPVPGDVSEADVPTVVAFWKQLNAHREALGDLSAQVVLCLDLVQAPFAFSHARDLISWCSPKFEFMEVIRPASGDGDAVTRDSGRDTSGASALLTWNSLLPLWQQIVASGRALSAADASAVLLPLLRSAVGLGMVTQGARLVRQGTTVSFSNDSIRAEWLTLCGDLAVAQGDLVRAGSCYSEAKIIRESLVARDPAKADFQRNISVSLNKLGDLAVAQGDLSEAERRFTESKTIAEHLVASDPDNPQWQRDLSVSLECLGDLAMAQGNLTEALRCFTRSRTLRERLAASDPANSQWQRDLWISNGKLGELATTQGDIAGALDYWTKANKITSRLAASDPASSVWQRDLSVSLNFLGNIAIAQGRLDDSRRYYTEYKAIAERLAASDPANAGWQRDLSVALEKLGDLCIAQGDLAGAFRFLTESKTIRERLAAGDIANARWQRDLAASRMKLIQLAQKKGDQVEMLASSRSKA